MFVCKQQLEAFRPPGITTVQMAKVPELHIKQCSFFKLHNLETLDFSTLPTIEEASWLPQNVLKHVFVSTIWLYKPLIYVWKMEVPKLQIKQTNNIPKKAP